MNKKSLKPIPKSLLTDEISVSSEVNPDRLSVILAECDKQGLLLSELVKTVKDSLIATKTIVDKYGEEHVEKDHQTRLKGAMLGLELRGELKNKDAGTGAVNFIDVKMLINNWEKIPGNSKLSGKT